MKIFLSIFLVLVSFATVFPQSKKARNNKVDQRNLSSILPGVYSDKPFNVNVQNLPPYFLGNNARWILPKLFDFALETIKGCGKFETTEVCQNRLNGIYDRVIYRGLTGRDLVAFSVPVNCSYSADEQKSVCAKDFLAKNYMWSHELIDSGSYVGENAFGVKKIIQYRKYENIDIKFNDTETKFTLLDFKPEIAEKVVPNFHFLIIGEILQPFVESNPAEYKPTISEPEDIKGNNYTIILDMKQVWLYDIATGKVWAKQIPGVNTN